MKNLERKMRTTKDNEKRLQQLILELKKAGFPIEEFYKKMLNKNNISESSNSGMHSVTSESEYIISNRLIVVNKPEHIPNLELEKVSPESISSSNISSTEYYNNS